MCVFYVDRSTNIGSLSQSITAPLGGIPTQIIYSYTCTLTSLLCSNCKVPTLLSHRFLLTYYYYYFLLPSFPPVLLLQLLKFTYLYIRAEYSFISLRFVSDNRKHYARYQDANFM